MVVDSNLKVEKIKNPIFERANQLADICISSFKALRKEEEVFKPIIDVWYYVFPGELQSPKFMMLSKRFLVIKFPKNSKPYRHKLIDEVKIATIQEGELHCQRTGKNFKEGDEFEIYPDDEYLPYAKDKKCIATIKLRPLNN